MMKNELEEGELANKASENPNVSSEIELEQPAIIPYDHFHYKNDFISILKLKGYSAN